MKRFKELVCSDILGTNSIIDVNIFIKTGVQELINNT